MDDQRVIFRNTEGRIAITHLNKNSLDAKRLTESEHIKKVLDACVEQGFKDSKEPYYVVDAASIPMTGKSKKSDEIYFRWGLDFNPTTQNFWFDLDWSKPIHRIRLGWLYRALRGQLEEHNLETGDVVDDTIIQLKNSLDSVNFDNCQSINAIRQTVPDDLKPDNIDAKTPNNCRWQLSTFYHTIIENDKSYRNRLNKKMIR